MVRRSPGTASRAAIRPLITAGPIERAARPPSVSASMVTSWARASRTPGGARRRQDRAAARIPARPRPNRAGMTRGLVRRAGLARRGLRGVALGSAGRLGRGGGGHLVARVVELRIDLDLVDDDVLLLGVILGTHLDRERVQKAADFLVVSDGAHELDLAAAD